MTHAPSAIGLDIDRRSARLVRVARRFGRTVVTHVESTTLPDSGSGHEVTLRFLESLHLTHERCAMPIFGRSVLLNILAVPQTGSSRERFAAMEIERLGFLSEEPMTGDSSSTSGDTAANSVLIAMAQTQAIDNALTIPDQIGLTLTHLLPLPMALLRANSSRSSAPSIMVHIGEDSTHLVIGGRMGLAFSRRFEIGSSHFTEAIRSQTGLRTDLAEDAKKQSGLRENATEPHVAAALRGMVDTWIAEIQSALSLWSEKNGDQTLGENPVILFGQEFNTPNFPAYVSAKLKRTVKAASSAMPGMVPDQLPTFAVALGLALTALDRSDHGINLLPKERRLAFHLREHRSVWLRTAAALVVSLVIILAVNLFRQKQANRVLATTHDQLQTLQTQDRELTILRQKNDALEARLQEARIGTHTSPTVHAFLSALSAAKHDDDWVTAIVDAKSYFPQPPQGSGPQPTPDDRHLTTLIVEGYTPRKDFSTVLSMIETLRHAPSVEFVDLVTDDHIPAETEARSRWKPLDASLFVIEIRLREI